MQNSDEETYADESNTARSSSISRREFLKTVGVAAGVIAGLGAGLGGLLAGCSGSQQATNTTATIHPGRSTTTVTGTTSTTVSAGPVTGRDIKLGIVSARSGPLALWGKADDWWTAFALEAVADGVLCGDGKVHKFTFASEDCRSDPEQAGRLAVRLISENRVDLLMCSGGMALVNPVADQAEDLGCPCICSFVQWRPFVFGRGGETGKPFTWTYAHAIGLEDIATNFVATWDLVETNKKVGLMFADDANGLVWADEAVGLPAATLAAGYEVVSPGPYPAGSSDFSLQISEFKKAGCEICSGAMTTKEFIDFWQQCMELEYRPKTVAVGEALLLPHAIEAIGSTARNTIAESYWQPGWPYKDSITGKTSQELARDYMSKTGDQWIAPIAQYAKFEWAVDALKRVTNIDSPSEIVARLSSTNLETCLGLIDFTAPIDTSDLNKSKRPHDNVYKAPVGAAQWVTGDTFEYEPRLVAAVNSPDLSVSSGVEPMDYGLTSSVS